MILLSTGLDLLIAAMRADRDGPDSAWLLYGPADESVLAAAATVEDDDLPLAAE